MTGSGSPPPFLYDIEEDETDIIEDMSDWNVGSMVLLDADMDSYLLAIQDLVGRLRQDDKETTEKIKEIEARSGHPSWNERSVEYLIEHYHSSGYQDAVHSMATVAVLAPFFETMFKQAFPSIRKWLEREDRTPPTGHARWQMALEKQWDCQFATKGRKNIVAGILELAEASGLAADLPSDLPLTLGALFAYRNKMFHLGVEWPEKERNAFAKAISAQRWPQEWFSQWTSDGKPFMFYLTDTYVDHCLETISGIIPGIGKFLRRNRRPRRRKS